MPSPVNRQPGRKSRQQFGQEEVRFTASRLQCRVFVGSGHTEGLHRELSPGRTPVLRPSFYLPTASVVGQTFWYPARRRESNPERLAPYLGGEKDTPLARKGPVAPKRLGSNHLSVVRTRRGI